MLSLLPEKLVSYRNTTRHHNPEEFYLKRRRRESLETRTKSQVFLNNYFDSSIQYVFRPLSQSYFPFIDTGHADY
jgi:hypothetical protein